MSADPLAQQPARVNLLGLFELNPNHVLVRAARDQQFADLTAFVAYTAALSVIALLVVALAVWRAGNRPRVRWISLTQADADPMR